MNFWRKVFTIARKDVLFELRSREIVFAVLVFAILVIVIFNFAFGIEQEIDSPLASGILWVTFVFSGILSFNRSFIMEKEEGCLEGLMLCPAPREVIFLGKMIATLLFIFLVELAVLVIFTVLFDVPVFSLPLITVIILATIGFTVVGTPFSALAVNTKAREMILPILFIPIVTPVIIGAVKATESLLSGGTWGDIATWLQVLGAFNVIFMVVSYLVFNFIIEE